MAKGAKKSKIGDTRYIDVKIINVDKRIGAKVHDIITNEANGKRVVIQDNYEGPISEYVYNNLISAQIKAHIPHFDESGKLVHMEKVDRPRIEVIPLDGGRLYTAKEKAKEEAGEAPEKRRGRPPKPADSLAPPENSNESVTV